MSGIDSITLKHCENVVRRYLKTDDVQTLDFAVEHLPKNCKNNGNNFLVKITVRHNGKKRELSFFAKSNKKENIVGINQILFEDFKKTIPEFDPKITPKIYYEHSDVLLFEDLTWQGFETHKSAVGLLHLDHLKVGLKVLAKFHAGTFAYEEVKSKEKSKIYRLGDEYKLVYTNSKLGNKDAVEVVCNIQKLLSEDDKNDEAFKSNLLKLLDDVEDRQLASKFRKTLCHCNLKSENIMYKYENGAPVDCKLINFKVNHYAPPVCDVLQLIYFNTSPELRQHHLDSLFCYYHCCLKEELKKYSSDISDLLTFDQLKLSANYLLSLAKLETVYHHCFHTANRIENSVRRNGVEWSEFVSSLLQTNERFRRLLTNAFTELEEIMTESHLTKEDCNAIVKSRFGSTNYDILSYKLMGVDESNGYLGDYYKLRINVAHRSENHVINCFVKCMPSRQNFIDVMESTGAFFKEAFVYETLVPQMEKLNLNAISECIPRCYFQRSEDLFVFEDLSLQNYITMSALVPYDTKLLKVTLKKLAKFHAALLAFEEKMTEKLRSTYRLFDHFEKYVKDIYFVRGGQHYGSKLMETGVRSILDVVNLYPELKTEENQKKIQALWPKLQDIFFSVTKPSEVYRNVLNHGDLWTNNILVKFNGDEPVDCVFVDYQTTRYCPPAHDFLSILHLTTDRATRLKSEQQLLHVYHDALEKYMAEYNYDIKSIYSYKDFLDSVNEIKPQMVMQSIMYFMFSMISPEDKETLMDDEEFCRKMLFEDRKEYLERTYAKSEVFRRRLREVLLDFYDVCDDLYK